jgi:hypothetical protein
MIMHLTKIPLKITCLAIAAVVPLGTVSTLNLTNNIPTTFAQPMATSNTSSSNSTSVASINTAKTLTNKSLVVAQSPFYESHVGKLIGQVVSNSGAPQVQLSIVENGTMKGVGNVTNLETWWDTYKTPTIINGVGHGILTTKDGQMATWIAHSIGRININTGVRTFKGIMFFNTNSTGSLGFLNNLAGLFIRQTNGNMRTAEIWEWK